MVRASSNQEPSVLNMHIRKITIIIRIGIGQNLFIIGCTADLNNAADI